MNRPLEAIDPATGELLRRTDAHTTAEIDRRLRLAAAAQLEWRTTVTAQRVRSLFAAADILSARSAEWAALMAVEMGKPITQGRAEAEKCAWVLRHYAEHAKAFLAPEPAKIDGARAYVRRDPLGVLLAIMPWNFPFWQVFRVAAPALVAGNAVVLKHAPSVPGCALAIERIFAEAGLPMGLFTSLLIHDTEAAAVIADPRVTAVTLTGSERAGAEVASLAGRHLKKTVLELGGSDAFIVLADADLEKAIDVAVKARVQNGGQSCIAAKRFMIDKSVAPKFIEGLRQKMAALKLGSPLEVDTELGPMARGDLRDGLHAQVIKSVEEGARLILGGVPRPGPGFYYPPTILIDCDVGVTAWDEETFGPVAAVMVVHDAERAVEAANASSYGLGASIWTRDLTLAERLAARVDAGSVFINGMVKSDPRVPFGGVKRSGYGRELGRYGLDEWTNLKTVWIEPVIALLLLLAAPPVVDPAGTVDPKAEAAWTSADALRRARRSEEALVAFESLATAHPTSRRAVQALAAAGTIARWELEDPARAKRLWIRALQGPSEVPGSDAALNELLALERDTGGVDAELALTLKLAQRRAGYTPRLWLRAAEIYLERKDLSRALEAARAVARIEGTWWDDAAMMEGRVLSELGRLDEALDSYRRVTASQRATLLGGDENSDLLDDAFLAIAKTLERAGRAVDAEQAYERLVDEVPHSVYVDDALDSARSIAQRRGDAEAAAKHRARLVKLRPTSRSSRPPG